MNRITQLKNCRSRIDLAILLNCKPSYLTYLLYKTKPENNYNEFEISKKNGGVRKICAPREELKALQRSLSVLLLDCIDNINTDNKIKNTLAHGFSREKSIITNAEMHRCQKNVLNIDLKNFFGEFNFGRVRGFFLNNHNFSLSLDVATTIAQIACYDNELPQGSPCSPVITNLITHILDIRLARLAKKHSCTYTRYADDITFSTRKKMFPEEIMAEPSPNVYIPSIELKNKIERAGFRINDNKTRIQYKDSRQDVTGLIVNKKIGIKKEYRQLTKAMCNSLFHHGKYTKVIDDTHIVGSINELEGRLNFIDYVDYHNRINHPEKLSIYYQHKKWGLNTKKLLTGRETTLSKFMFYKYFVGNEKATILCEGKTDNVYIKAALRQLAMHYPDLVSIDVKTNAYKSNLNIINYNKRTKFLLELAGGTPYITSFINKYNECYSFYKGQPSENPVIIILDNDQGLDEIINVLDKIKTCKYHPQPVPKTLTRDKAKKSDFIHVCHNLYLVITPLDNNKDTMIEDLFDPKLWSTVINGRTFDPTEKKTPKQNFYGKNVFATEVIKPNQKMIDFNGFIPLFTKIANVIKDYR